MERPSTSRPRGMCRFYTMPGGCREGDRCKFLHGVGETLTPYDKAKTCKFFAAGYCTRGASCWFRHVQPDAPANPLPQPVQEADEDACSVCYEKPTTYGLLTGCSHIFCIKCIRDWRDRSQKSEEVISSGNLKRCPLCRQDSRFVVPSSIFLPDGAEKQRLVGQYKASMARVSCRHFTESGGTFCPFGHDCFYQHLNADGTVHHFAYGAANPPRRRGSRWAPGHPLFGGFNFPFDPHLFFGEVPSPSVPVEPIFDDPIQELSVTIDTIRTHLPDDGRGGRRPGWRGGRGANPLLPGLTGAEVQNLTDRLLASIRRLRDRSREPSPAAGESSDSDSEAGVLPALEPVTPPRAHSPQTIHAAFSVWGEPAAGVGAAVHHGDDDNGDMPALEPIDPPPTRYVHAARAPTPVRFSTVVPRRAQPPGPSPLRDGSAIATRAAPARSWATPANPPRANPARPVSPHRQHDVALAAASIWGSNVIVVSDSEEDETVDARGEGSYDGMPSLINVSDEEDDEVEAIGNARWTAEINEASGDDDAVLRHAREAVQRAEQVRSQTRAMLDRETAPMAPPVSLPEDDLCVDAGAPESNAQEVSETPAPAEVREVVHAGVHSQGQSVQEGEVQDDGWSSLLIPDPPFKTDGRGKVVFASANAEPSDDTEVGREGRRRRCGRL